MSLRTRIYKGGDVPEPIRTNPTTLIPNVDDTDTIYYEAIYTNDQVRSIPAAFTDFRQEPLVKDLSQYKITVRSFNIQLQPTPMFRIGSEGKSMCRCALYYQPDNLTATAPLFNSDVEITNIDQFINATDGLNDQLEACFADLKNQYDIIHGPGTWAANPLLAQNPPGFYYSSDARLISLYQPPQNIDGNINAVGVFLSYDIAPLFAGLVVLDDYPPTLPPLLWTRFSIYAGFRDINLEEVPVGSGTFFYRLTQQYSSTSAWYTRRKIVLSSKSLSNRKTYLKSQRSSEASSVDNSQLEILADGIVRLSNDAANPSTLYAYDGWFGLRWIDGFKHQGLKYLDFNVSYITDSGTVEEAYLPPYQSLILVIQFTKAPFVGVI